MMVTIKNVKKLLALLTLVILTGFMSCDNQNADTAPQDQSNEAARTSRLRFVSSRNYDTSTMGDWQQISTTPGSIQTYITENYSSATIEEIWLTNTGEYIVLLDNDKVLVFNASEQFVIAFDLEGYVDSFDDDFEEIDSAALPQPILDYLSTNHAGEPIEVAGLNDEDGEYVVVLESGIVLVFDRDGNFVEQFTEDDYDDEDDFEEIDSESLPQAIKDYIASNHADATIEEAGYDSFEEEYGVILSTGLILVFDKDGNFIESFDENDDYEDHCEEVAVADLPQSIKDYVATNYTGQDIVEAWLDSEEGEYYIELANETVLIFDTDGNFIEEYTEDDEDDEDDD